MIESWPLLAGAGFLAGAMNAAAGGGSFVTLPALVFAGLPSVAANASSTVALYPGGLAGAYGFRGEFLMFPADSPRAMLTASLLGGAVGALLLLNTPSVTFDRIIPWLMLLGAFTFAFGNRIGMMLQKRVEMGKGALLTVQVLLAIYGGYFGGAVGIMMMAAWSLFGLVDLKAMSAARTLMVAATNSVAVLCFSASGIVAWPQTLVMMGAAVAGGYLGARLARNIATSTLRLGINLLNAGMTLAIFVRAYG